MSFLLSRNPLVAGLRAAVGLGLLADGLLGLGAVGSWSAGGLSPAGYQALPECAGDPVPTDGTCYSVLAGTVRSTRQQLTRDFVTITDARATRVVELASGDRFATFRPATVVAVKYLGSTVTAVGVPVPGGTQALTSTVDSPLVHRAVLGRRLRYIAAGLVGLLLGGLPLLFGRRQRWGRRPASAHVRA